MRSPSSSLRYDALVFALVGLLLVGYTVAVAGIYVSPSGSPEWTGNCSAIDACNMTSPCGLPTTPISLFGNVTTCKIFFYPGNYSGAHVEIEDSKNVDIEFGDLEWEHERRSANLHNGTVSDISLFIRSYKLVMFGEIAHSKVNISLEKSISTYFDEISSTQTTWVFSAAAPFAIRPKITANSCRFSLTGTPVTESEIANVFTFDVSDAAKDSTIRILDIVNSRIYLSAGYSGLVHSSGSLGPASITLTDANTLDAHHIYSFEEATPTELWIANSKVEVSSNIFRAVNGVDPATFNSKTTPLTLKLSVATIIGPENALAQSYDPNGCVNLDLKNSVVKNLEINCNAIKSIDSKDRCTYSVSGTTFRDNHLCVSGVAGSVGPSFSEVGIVVSMPPIAPVMTVFNNVDIKSNTWTILTTATRPSDSPVTVESPNAAPAAPAVPFLLTGVNTFTSTISAQYLTLDAGALARFDRVLLDTNSEILLRDKSTFASGANIYAHDLSSPISFKMDGPGSAIVDMRSLEWYLIVRPDPVSIASGAPLLNMGPGVTLNLPADSTFFKMFLQVPWNKTLLGDPRAGARYLLTNNAAFSRSEPRYRYQFKSGNYNFDAWSEPNYHVCPTCSKVYFGLSESTIIPVNAPITVTPTFSAPSSSDDCRGYAPSTQGWVCRLGSWRHDGDWLVTDNVTLIGSSIYTTKFYVEGALTFSPGSSITLVGKGAGLSVRRCATITNPHQILIDYASGWPNYSGWLHFVLDQSPSCDAVGYLIPVTVIPPPLNPTICDYVVIVPKSYGGTGLQLDFTYEHRKCSKLPNKTIFIIIGVVAGIFVIAGIIIGLVVFFRRRSDAAKTRSLNGGFSSDYEPLINNH